MQRLRSLACPALITGALLFAGGAGAAEEPGGGKAEERKAEPESPRAGEAGGRKAEEPKSEPESPDAEEAGGEKAKEPETEPVGRDAGEPAEKTAAPARTPLDLKGTPMTDAVFEIQRQTGVNIVVHPDLVRANPTITLRVENMPLGSALNWICVLAGAKYVLEDEAIYIIPRGGAAGRN